MEQADRGVKPCISWIGSKEKLQRIIRSVFPPDYDRQTEHFGGSGAILLGGRKIPGVLLSLREGAAHVFVG